MDKDNTQEIRAWVAQVRKRYDDGFLSSDPNIAFAAIEDVPALLDMLEVAIVGLDFYCFDKPHATVAGQTLESMAAIARRNREGQADEAGA